MAKNYARLHKALREAGAIHMRRGKHHIYKLPNQRIFVMPSTPSGRENNYLAQLRRALSTT